MGDKHWCEGMENMDKKITYLENKVNQRDHQIDALKYKEGCTNCDRLDAEIVRRGDILVNNKSEIQSLTEQLKKAEEVITLARKIILFMDNKYFEDHEAFIDGIDDYFKNKDKVSNSDKKEE